MVAVAASGARNARQMARYRRSPDHEGRQGVTVLRVDNPPSLNQILNRHWRVASREKKRLEAALEAELSRARAKPQDGKLVATIDFVFPTNRRRDEGNYRAPIEKALGDVIQRVGLIEDDTHDRFSVRECLFIVRPGSKPHALVRLTWE